MVILPPCDNRNMKAKGRHSNGRRLPQAIPPVVYRIPGKEVMRSVLGFDRMWFTYHALQRMKERGVTETQVISVLKQPTKKGLKTQPNRKRWRRDNIDVIFEEWPNQLGIITVFKVNS